jgi:hypothetical protein
MVAKISTTIVSKSTYVRKAPPKYLLPAKRVKVQPWRTHGKMSERTRKGPPPTSFRTLFQKIHYLLGAIKDRALYRKFC